MEILLSTPYWFLIFCILTGLVFAWLLYARTSEWEEVRPWLKRLMAAVRFISVSFLCFLLLSPFVKTNFREVEKPVIAIAVDNSESMRMDSLHNSTAEIVKAVNELTEELQKNYDVKLYSFGSETRAGSDLNFSEKSTDISGAMDYIQSLYAGRNLGSVILVSDGIYNSGSNPVYKASELKVPVNILAVGDTTVHRDLSLAGISYNKTVNIGNNFPLEIRVAAKQSAGASSVLTVSEKNEVLFTKPFSITGNNFFTTVPVFLTAKTKGVHSYKISLSTIDGEKNIQNNNTEIFIEVTDSKLKVLLIAQSPHPDIAAIRSMLDKTSQYQLTVAYADQFQDNLSLYNLVILHQLPSVKSSEILKKLQVAQLPYLVVLGAQSSVAEFNKLGTGVSISQPISKNSDVYASVNGEFSLFSVTDDMKKMIATFPPLSSPFGTYRADKEIYTLLTQRIGAVETGQPLLYFSNAGNIRKAVLAGEGIWRWRLNEYAQKESTTNMDELFGKIIQYLIVKESKVPFRVRYKKSLNENEQAMFDAELLNPAGEFTNEPEVKIVITNEAGKEYSFIFSRVSNTYHLNAGYLSPGKYSFRAEVKSGDKVYTEGGEFAVSKLMLETTETTADYGLLYSIASSTKGVISSMPDISPLVKAIQADESVKPVSYYHTTLSELLNLKWIMVILLLLLSLEWFLRKRSGSY